MIVMFNENIPDHEERALKYITRLLAKPWSCADQVGVLSASTLSALAGVETIDDVAAISPTVCEWALQKAEEGWEKKRKIAAGRWVAKAINRTTYMPTGRLEMRAAKSKADEDIHRWHGTMALECAGLLPRMVDELYGKTASPVAVAIVNMLPPSMELGLKHAPVNTTHWENMLGLGLAVSGERVAWEMNSPAWAMLNKCFPLAIDARAYNHSLKAPLVQGGYLPGVICTFKNLSSFSPIGGVIKSTRGVEYVKSLEMKELARRALSGISKEIARGMVSDMEELYAEVQTANTYQEMEEVLAPWGLLGLLKPTTIYKRVSAEDDGSGRYHPDCPEMADLVTRYGLVPMQVRAVDPDHGMFAKGILVPDASSVDAKGNPCITFSWKQIKGRWKKLAGERAEQNAVGEKKMHLGILRAWDRKRFMVGCFELLENIGVLTTPGESQESINSRVAQIKEDINSLVDEAMADLGKDGINGLLAQVAKDDKVLSLVVKLLARAESRGIHIDPMSIDRVKQALDQKLQRRLWAIAQGAGIEGRQLVIVNDGGLAPGEVVVSHFKVGQELAIWRFPMVLAQGLQVHRVVSPRPHHLVQGKVVEQTIYMNPKDVLDMQGDDDGDIVAATPDPRVIRLFREKLDNRRFFIEPAGEKLSMRTDSPEGLEYLRSTPMGPVGVFTICRSKLLAVGDHMGALAMSVAVQEAIDKAKRKVRWSDWEKACDMGNWKLGVDGMYRLHWEGSENYLDQRGEDHDDVPMILVLKWVNSRLALFGCSTEYINYGLVQVDDGLYQEDQVKSSPLGWRIQWGEEEDVVTGEVKQVKLTKRICPSKWTRARDQQGGYQGGNLVHESHDRAWERWADIEAEFDASEKEGDISELLMRLLAEEGIEVTEPQMEWFHYLEERKLSGIADFSDAMKAALSQEKNEADGSDNSSRYADINSAYDLLAQRMREYTEWKGIQGLVDIWCMEMRPMYRVSDENGTWHTQDRESIPSHATFSRVSNPNHGINAVCWAGSPILKLLDIEGEDVCGFLTADRLKAIIAHVVDQPNAFETLAGLIWSTEGGAHRKQTGIPVADCEHCRNTVQTELVRYFRSANSRLEKKFLARIVGTLNKGENTMLPVGDETSLGISMATLLAMANDELQELHDGLMDSARVEDRATIKIIERILTSQI